MKKKPKAVSLISGGLDSILATKIVKDQDVYVEGVHFDIGFNDTQRLARKTACSLGIRLNNIDLFDQYKAILKSPCHGYGKNLNPCVDCKILMLSEARKWLKKHDFDFIITGEVVGQRPNSQRRDAMAVIEKQSLLKDILLRPLSAKLLPETFPEREKMVDRELLFDINGRSRKNQLDLVKQFNIEDFPQPAGGCFLTEFKTWKTFIFKARFESNYRKK